MRSQRPISLSFDRGTLLLTGLEDRDSPNVTGYAVWMWDAHVGGWRCEPFHYASIGSLINGRLTPRLQVRG